MIDAVVFDMDGVLIETESVYKETFKQILSKYGAVYCEEFFLHLTGTTLEKDGATKIIERFNLPVSEKQLIEEIYETFDEISSKLKPREGVLETIKTLKELKKHVALATSTVKDRALQRLERCGLADFFDVMVFGDEVINSKPDPQIYLKALERLKTEGSRVVVFEDSVNGIKSAIGAGISSVLGVLHDYNDRESLIKAGAVCADEPPQVFFFFLEKLLQL